VVFIAATMDNVIRAFDVRNGKMLWRSKLPAGGQATPMTYTVNGRQFLVMVTGNHMWFGSPAGDEVVAYALPQKAH
jgi:quinoprotein glucose dehydrogenase